MRTVEVPLSDRGDVGMGNAPDEMTLEFGRSSSAEADVVIAGTATAANFAVTPTWNRSDREDANGDTP